jgi:hypothetical protein
MTRQHRLWMVLGLLGFLSVVAVLLMVRGRPPQMGNDEAVFRAVDALFTAVTARDESLLRQCEQQLDVFRQSGQLPREAAVYLDDVIRTSRAGGWEAGAKKLYEFMRAQRREGRITKTQ